MDGRSLSGAGYTRDISPIGVFVFSAERIPLATTIRLAITLPSTSRESAGATLNTVGRVVRSEEDGFAVAADMGLRMQFSEKRGHGLGKVGRNSSDTKETQDHVSGLHPISRFSI